MPTRRKRLRRVFQDCIAQLRVLHDDIAAGRVVETGDHVEVPA